MVNHRQTHGVIIPNCQNVFVYFSLPTRYLFLFCLAPFSDWQAFGRAFEQYGPKDGNICATILYWSKSKISSIIKEKICSLRTNENEVKNHTTELYMKSYIHKRRLTSGGGWSSNIALKQAVPFKIIKNEGDFENWFVFHPTHLFATLQKIMQIYLEVGLFFIHMVCFPISNYHVE